MATNIKLLDENALSAIKTYVDTQVGKAGKVDDVQLNGSTVVSNKVANILTDQPYSATQNKIATVGTVTSAIGALDVSNISGFGAGKTLATLTETDGKIAATFQDIQLGSTAKVTGLDTALGNKLDKKTTSGTYVYTHNGSTQGEVAYSTSATASNIVQRTTGGQVTVPTAPSADSDATSKSYVDLGINSRVPNTRTIAGLYLSSDITSASLITALGLQQAMTYIGVATTTKPSAGHYVQTVIGGTTYYVSMGTEGAAQQEYAQKGQILTVGTKEYICTTAGASGTNVFSEMGDESSYALKTIKVSAGSGLSGGGDLTQNRTISHATPSGAATKSSGFYKFSTDSFGHVNGTTAVAKADLTGLGVADDSAVVHKGTSSSSVAEDIYGVKTFKTYVNATSYYAGSHDSSYTSYANGNINIGNGSSPTAVLTLPTTTGTLALTSQIPTNYVTTNTAQTISGKKTFSHADGIAISNAGATATLSVTNDSETGELNIGGVSYLEASNIKANIGVIETNREVTKYFGSADFRSDVFVPKDYVIKTASYSDAVEDATYGIKIPDTHGYTANRTLATTADIPSVSDFVKGPSSSSLYTIPKFNNLTGKLIAESTLTVNDGNSSTETKLTTSGKGLFIGGGGGNITLRPSGNSSGNGLVILASGTVAPSTDDNQLLGSSDKVWAKVFTYDLSDGTNSATVASIKSHLDNTTVHITSAERTAWNAKISSVKSIDTSYVTSQSTATESVSGSGTIALHRVSKTGKLSHLLSDDGGSVSVITTAEINAILYPSA